MTTSTFRVALVGPEATGKSELARALAARFNLSPLDDPRPAFLRATGCHTLFEAGQYRPVWRELLEEQLDREAALGERVVLDSCAIDYWVLWQRWGWCGAPPQLSEKLYRAVVEATRRYTHVLVLPAAQVAPFAGHRFLNPDYAAQVLRQTRAFLTEAAPAAQVSSLDAEATEKRLARLVLEDRPQNLGHR